jgi:hypothetical protein
MFDSKQRTQQNEISGTSSNVNKISKLSVAEKDAKCLFSLVKKDTSNLPKPSPQCEMLRLHIIVFFSKY